MNVYKAVALTFAVATAITAGAHVASAQGAGQCGNQPNMWNALVELRNARVALDRAAADKGGFRVQAVEWTNRAIGATERGCAVANGR
ncbi:MAG TPA: hypothetical protein VGG39_06720 [Polyangiaceae bacterium]|jgi:hypothetical protein